MGGQRGLPTLETADFVPPAMSSQDFHEGIETLFDMKTYEWRTLSILGYSVL